MVNVYLLEEAGEVTVIDAGMAGMYGDLVTELAAMGRSIGDIRAVVLTHGHSDHIGMADRIRRERRVPAWVHDADAALARGEVPNPARGLGPYRARPLLAFLLYGLRRGGVRRPKVAEVATFGDDATLDVPGAPRVVLVPGHTPGSAALHVERRQTLFVGDAFATLAVTTGSEGPQVAPFSANPDQAVASLDRLADVHAAFALPGHGRPWTAGMHEAIRQVRARHAATGSRRR
jgi:glyoxylase-like metal-dependent hydrolase (beta-lactamase superfamily II)